MPVVVSALVLLALAIPLAFGGAAFVPGTAAGAPDWLLGIAAPIDGGIGIAPSLYAALLGIATIAWVLALALAPRLGVRAMAALAGLGVGIFLLAPPLHSLDVFSYISYARLAVEHGLDPYEWAPAAIPADQAAIRVDDYRDAVSVYGPLFTALSLPLGAVSVGLALWSLKALAAASVLALAAIVARLAARRGVSPAFAVAVVALNPLVLVHVVGGAHNDALMALAGMLAVAGVLGARDALAASAAVAAIAIKAAAVVYAPFALIGSGSRLRMLLGAATAFVVLSLLSLSLFGADAVEAFGVLGANQGTVSRWSVPGAVSRLTGIEVDLLRSAFAVLYALVALWLLARCVGIGRRPPIDWVRGAAWASVLLLVASSYMVPWYLIWALPLVAIARDRALLAVTVALTALQVPNGLPL